MLWKLLSAILTLALTTLSQPAAAQPEDTMRFRCGDAKAMHGQLEAMYRERPAAFGVASDGNLLQVYRSETGSWTVVTTTPDGKSCVLAAGQHWNVLPTTSHGPET